MALTTEFPKYYREPQHIPYTGGVWKAECSPDLCGFVIYSSEYGPTDTIAFVEGIWEADEANARIIAAAPTMKSLLQALISRPGQPPSPTLIALARDCLRQIATPLPEHQSGPYKVI